MTGRLLLALAIPTLLAGVVQAQDDAVEPQLQRAYELRERGDHEGARQILAEAYTESQSPKALAMLALAEHALHRWVDAHDHLREALAQDHPWIARTRPDLLRAMRDIEAHVARLELRGEPGTSYQVDGQPRGELPMPGPLALSPGSHVLEARRADGSVHTASRTLRAGQRWVETVPDAPAGVVAPPSGGGGGAGAAPWVIFGVAAAVAAAGAVMLAVGQSDVAAIEGSTMGREWPADDADRALILSNVGWVALSVGGVALAVSIVWALVDSGSSERALGRPRVIRF